MTDFCECSTVVCSPLEAFSNEGFRFANSPGEMLAKSTRAWKNMDFYQQRWSSGKISRSWASGQGK